MAPPSSRTLHVIPRIEDAVALHRAGSLIDAEAAYRAILAATPRHFDALHLLGVACTQQGRNEEAVTLVSKAVTLNPKSMDAHYNLGIALSALGRYRQAVTSYRRAVALNPRHALVRNNLGIALQELNQVDDAVAAFRQAIAVDPMFADAHFNLGRALAVSGLHEEAAVSYRAALSLRPDYPAAQVNLGAALISLARYSDALECLNAALRAEPNSVMALSNLGNALTALERYEEAIACLERAITLDPRYAEAHNNLANALKSVHRYDEAISHYSEAIAIKPGYVEAMTNRGSLLNGLGRYRDAIAQFRQALEIRPDFSEAHVYLLFALDFDPTATVEEQQAERRRWYEHHGRRFASRSKPHGNDRDPNRKLRIGYVSADFRHHSAAVAFGPAVAHHDLERFDVVLYSNTKTEDEGTKRFRAAASDWRPIRGLSDDAVADLIRNDRIDILVDLTGHTDGSRLLVFARKPAPVQVTGWGSPTGTGIPEIDYLLADPVTIPAEVRPLFAETVVDIPSTLGFEPPVYAPDVGPAPCIDGSPFTFGCFNRLSKVSDAALALWARILREIPESRLVLKDTQLADGSVRGRLISAFADLGVPEGRLTFLGGTPHAEHLGAYGRVDVALDPFPATGGVTTLEALWMGVPVITKMGRHVSGRVPSGVLTALGLSDWIAQTDEDYLDIARRWAGDLVALTTLRSTLRPKMQATPIGDPAAYCRAVEAAYRRMWVTYCRGH
jgi:predicted O-linked N-acetylglucosamine transferase (SPINDLY family)